MAKALGEHSELPTYKSNLTESSRLDRGNLASVENIVQPQKYPATDALIELVRAAISEYLTVKLNFCSGNFCRY
jgi:hypothetical protein